VTANAWSAVSSLKLEASRLGCIDEWEEELSFFHAGPMTMTSTKATMKKATGKAIGKERTKPEACHLTPTRDGDMYPEETAVPPLLGICGVLRRRAGQQATHEAEALEAERGVGELSPVVVARSISRGNR
jgi:hypothetical protein